MERKLNFRIAFLLLCFLQAVGGYCFAQTSGESSVVLLNERNRDTIRLIPGVSRVEYRRNDAEIWQKGRVMNFDENGMVVGDDSVKWEAGVQLKGYSTGLEFFLDTNVGVYYFWTAAIVLGIAILVFPVALIFGSPIYIALPKLIGFAMATVLPILWIWSLVVMGRFRKIIIGDKWRVAKLPNLRSKS